MPIFAWEIHVRNAMDKRLRMLAVLDEIGDGNDVEPVLFGKLLELGGTHHVPVVRHDLTAHPRRIQSRKTREIHRRLRMSRAAQHTALDRPQGEDVPRAAEMRGLCLRVNQHLHRMASLKRRDARCGIVGVDADREGSLVIVRIVLHHLTDLEFIETAAHDRRANESACVRRHEIHMLGCERLGSDDNIALVFAILIVHNNEHLAALNVLDCLCNRCKI